MKELREESQQDMNTKYVRTVLSVNSQNLIPVFVIFQEHIDTAISLKPDSPNLFYLRGRWSFEVAGLSWLEKKAAAALYATPPDATYDEALSDFMTCENLKGGVWKSNLMMVAKVRSTIIIITLF